MTKPLIQNLVLMGIHAEAALHKTLPQFFEKICLYVNLSVMCMQRDFSLMDLLYSPDLDGDTNRTHTSTVGLSFPY